MLRLSVHLRLLVAACAAAHRRLHAPLSPRRIAGDAGQTTAEYALVLLGAAAIAALMIAWASKSGAIGQLFDAVLSHVIGSVT